MSQSIKKGNYVEIVGMNMEGEVTDVDQETGNVDVHFVGDTKIEKDIPPEELKILHNWSPSSLMKKYREYIIHWASIQNTACRFFSDRSDPEKYQSRKYLKTLPEELDDPCNKRPVKKLWWDNKEYYLEHDIPVCTEVNNPALFSNTNDLDCQEYYSHSSEKWKCVSSHNIKHFEGNEKASHINGRFGETFILLETFPLDIGQRYEKGLTETRYEHIIYAQVYSYDRKDNNIECDSHQPLTNDLYVVFNCGIILDPEFIWDPIINPYLDSLYKYCLNYDGLINKVIISGHSMGAVLALRLGYYLNLINNHYFSETCLVIASGPYCWLKKTEMVTFTNFNNIVVMYNGEYANYKLWIDWIYYNRIGINERELRFNMDSFDTYYPSLIIYDIQIHPNRRKSNSLEDMTTEEVYLALFTKDTDPDPDGRYGYHDWDKYFSKIKRYYGLETVKKGGNPHYYKNKLKKYRTKINNYHKQW